MIECVIKYAQNILLTAVCERAQQFNSELQFTIGTGEEKSVMSKIILHP